MISEQEDNATPMFKDQSISNMMHIREMLMLKDSKLQQQLESTKIKKASDCSMPPNFFKLINESGMGDKKLSYRSNIDNAIVLEQPSDNGLWRVNINDSNMMHKMQLNLYSRKLGEIKKSLDQLPDVEEEEDLDFIENVGGKLRTCRGSKKHRERYIFSTFNKDNYGVEHNRVVKALRDKKRSIADKVESIFSPSPAKQKPSLVTSPSPKGSAYMPSA